MSETADLVKRAQGGDRTAFEALVVAYQGSAFGYAHSLLGDAQRAEDAAQDAFLIAYKSLSTLREAAAFPGWLRGIVFRCASRVWRGRRPFADLATAQIAEPRAADDGLENAELVAHALKALPPELREVVTLFYLQERSQKEVAAFLGIPETTVVNRLHKARSVIKRSLNIMKVGPEFAGKVADVLSVHDWLVEARMASPDAPEIFDVLSGFVVIQRGPDGKLVCLAKSPGDPVGRKLAWSGAEGASSQGFPDDAIRAAAAHVRGAHRGEAQILETGLKAIDLFCPLRTEGVTALFGTHGVGRLVVAEELINSIRKTTHSQGLLFFVSNWDVPGTQDALAETPELAAGVHGRVKLAWLISRRAVNPHFALEADFADTRIFCSPHFAARGLWPAIDPLYCASTAIDPVAVEGLGVLRRGRALLEDAKYYELLALGAHAEAKARYQEVRDAAFARANAADRTTILRAERLEWFLTQPFYVTAGFTGKPGVSVPLAETLDGCRRILAGDCDEMPAAALLYRGGLD